MPVKPIVAPGVKPAAKQSNPQTQAKAPPPFRPQALQLKTASPVQAGRPLAPPVYRPQPAGTLQARFAGVRPPSPPTLRNSQVPLAPPVFHPSRPGLAQAKSVSTALPMAAVPALIQLSTKGNPEKQKKQMAKAEAVKRSKAHKLDKSVKNAAAYGGVTADVARRFVAEHGHIPGHHSDDSNSKMNSGTATKVQELHAFARDEREERKEEADDGPAMARPTGGGGGVAPGLVTEEALLAAAAKVWNAALDDRNDPMAAVTKYLDGRALNDRTVTRALAESVKEEFAGWDVDEPYGLA